MTYKLWNHLNYGLPITVQVVICNPELYTGIQTIIWLRDHSMIGQVWTIQKPYYSGALNSGLVRISNGQKEVGFQIVQILNGI